MLANKRHVDVVCGAIMTVMYLLERGHVPLSKIPACRYADDGSVYLFRSAKVLQVRTLLQKSAKIRPDSPPDRPAPNRRNVSVIRS